LLLRVLHLRGALRASSVVLRSRNADPLERLIQLRQEWSRRFDI